MAGYQFAILVSIVELSGNKIYFCSERKRGRQTYTRYQTLELEKEFHFNR